MCYLILFGKNNFVGIQHTSMANNVQTSLPPYMQEVRLIRKKKEKKRNMNL